MHVGVGASHPKQKARQHEQDEVQQLPGEAEPCRRRCVRADLSRPRDYDELLREAVRVALRMDVNPARDDFDDLYGRIGRLMAAYIASPEGEGEDTCTLMSRLAVRMLSPLQFEKASNAPLKQRRWRMFVIRRHLSVEALQAELY